MKPQNREKNTVLSDPTRAAGSGGNALQRRPFAVALGTATVVSCLWLLVPNQQATGQQAKGGKAPVDPVFDIIYSLETVAAGRITVVATGTTQSGEKTVVPTNVLRVVYAGQFTKIYVNHPGEEAVTEIAMDGDDVSGIQLVNPAVEHRGHVTVLK